MEIAFENLIDHIIPMSQFGRKWRFTEDNYDVLPQCDLEKILPLNKEAALFLDRRIQESGMHDEDPFKKNFFKSVSHTDYTEGEEDAVRDWLNKIGFAADKMVALSWDFRDALLVPWSVLIKYFDSFYYGSSDDLTIVDSSLQWAVLFHHSDVVWYGYSQNNLSSTLK